MVLYADEDLLAPAQRLAARLTHSVYDCLYLSLAQRLSCPLVTADRRLAERGVQLGLSTTLIAPA
jgi:predicted nucleic acid-binding protein